MICCKCEEYGWDDPQPVVHTDLDNGKGYCLFHAPEGHKEVSVEDFYGQVLERIQATIDLEDETALCNFSGTIFSDIVFFRFGDVLPSISFRFAKFKGDVFLGSVKFVGLADFRSAKFEGDADFAFAEFEGITSFDSAKFEGDAGFRSAEFGEGAGFRSAEFERGAFFGSVQFMKDSYFGLAEFGRGTSFEGVKFGDDVDFDSVKFKENAYFGFAEFEETADFNSAKFEGAADFGSAKFGGLTHFGFAHLGEDADFRSTQFGRAAKFSSFIAAPDATLIFSNCIISSEAITFRDCENITCLDLTEQRDLSNIHFINSSWEMNGCIKACTEDDKLQPTRDFYQRMKAKYKAENNEYEASKWHVAEKEAQLKLLAQSYEKFNWFMLWLYKFSSGFGEKPRRAFRVLLTLLVLPLLLVIGVQALHQFPWWNFDMMKVDYVFKDWLKFLPLTRSIGDEPGVVRAFMFFWQLLITLQAALFAFALRNNFRR